MIRCFGRRFDLAGIVKNAGLCYHIDNRKGDDKVLQQLTQKQLQELLQKFCAKALAIP